MFLFWTFAGLLAAVAAALLLYPLLARRGNAGVSSDALNTALYAELSSEPRATS